MKVKNYLVLALAAATAFASCSKEQSSVAGDDAPKSVTLTVSNVVPGSRSAGSKVEPDSKVKFSDLQVFFATSDGNLVQGKTLDNQPAQHYFTTDQFDVREDKVFHFLPANVSKVIVVGNLGTEQTGVTTVDDLKRTLEIADEQNEVKLSLYDETELTTVSGTDEAGHPLYVAKLTLEPRVARIEVVGFEYQAVGENPRKYASIEIEQVVLNNYYDGADFLTGAVSGEKTNTEINEGSAFEFFANAAQSDAWYNDMLDNTTLPEVVLSASNDYKTAYGDGDKRPAYHIFPMAENIGTTDHPQLVVKLLGTTPDGEKVPLYLATSKFDPAVTGNVAKIYQVQFAFNDDNLSNPEKCVEVNVGVASWSVVLVSPEF